MCLANYDPSPENPRFHGVQYVVVLGEDKYDLVIHNYQHVHQVISLVSILKEVREEIQPKFQVTVKVYALVKDLDYCMRGLGFTRHANLTYCEIDSE